MGIFSRKPNFEKLIEEGDTDGLIKELMKGLKDKRQDVYYRAIDIISTLTAHCQYAQDVETLEKLTEAVYEAGLSDYIEQVRSALLIAKRDAEGLVEAVERARASGTRSPDIRTFVSICEREGNTEALILMLIRSIDMDNVSSGQADALLMNAASTLGRMKDETAVEPLTRAMHEARDPILRQTAIHALGDIGGKQAAGVLKRFIKENPDDSQFSLAGRAREALLKIQERKSEDVGRS